MFLKSCCLLLLPIAVSGFNCTFDTNVCGWTQDIKDDFDWTRSSVGTPSRGTGPNFDHTTRSGYYMYVRVSGRQPGQKARLISPAISGTYRKCLEFYYHMFGPYVYTLNVYFSRSGSRGSPAWTRHRSQGDSWRKALVQVPGGSATTAVTNVVFEGITGASYMGDIAIDDVSLKTGSCYQENCDFEIDMCGWKNSGTDDFNWDLKSGSTYSSNTGPTNDHTKGNIQGKYIYIETSSPRKEGDSAVLETSFFYRSTDKCMTFYYHMYGSSINTLRVLVQQQNQNASVLWSLTGQQGQSWMKGVVPLPLKSAYYRVLIEGIRGRSASGDIAIDDIAFNSQWPCILTPKTASVGSVNPGNCDFEIDMCGWSQQRTDHFDWERGSGSTNTSSQCYLTGPLRDHTRTDNRGKYIFIETSVPRQPGDTAVLESPIIHSTTSHCMTFYYHMYGTTMGTLRVLVQPQNQDASALWSLSGQQQTYWMKGVVPIPEESNNYKILIEGIRGSSFIGDIAIDDIVFTSQSPCSLTPMNASVAEVSPDVFIKPSLNKINVVVGEDLNVNCVVNDTNAAVNTITWSHNGRKSSGEIFHIQNVTIQDEGQLTCTAQDRVGTSPRRVEHVIRVVERYQEPTSVHMEPNTSTINARLGENVTVHCVVSASNPIIYSITWSHNGRISSGKTYYIQNVTHTDDGRLTCTATTREGTRPGRADTYIRVMEECFCKATVSANTESGTWTTMHTVVVVTGSLAVVVILILTLIIIHQCRKLHTLKAPKERTTVTKLGTVCETCNPTYDVTTQRVRRQRPESLHCYDKIEFSERKESNSEEPVYVNAAVIRETHS